MDLVLCETMEIAGQPVISLALSDGAQALVLPCSGRLLGLYAAGSDENFLWNNDALQSTERAANLFAGPAWPNPGGDRTWLAPELDLFIGDPARVAETYAVPRAMDPGNWSLVSATRAEVNLENQTRLSMLRSSREVGVRLVKRYTPAVSPLLGSSVDQAGLQYAGYALATALELDPSAGSPVRLGIWNLLQLPQPGTLLIPSCESAKPHVVFGTPSAGELTVEPGAVRWYMAPPGGDAKISLKAHALTGRAGYLRETGTPGIQDLVVREFAVGAERDYVDALWEPPYETGWAFQACCVRNGPDRFNELEYHVPAATTEAGKNICHDESRVWAFRGPKGAVAGVARHLLGDSVIG